MTLEVIWTAEARADLIEISRHVAHDNPVAAESLAARIFDAGSSLGAGVPGRAGRIVGTFEKVVGRLPYILAYQVAASPDGATRIVILHVVHGARHWPEGEWPAD